MLEILESRIAPAVLVSVHKGVLHITKDPASATADNLAVTQTAADTFTVMDTVTATDYGSFPGVKSIDAELGGTDDAFNLEVSGAGLRGNLKINTGDGANAISLSTLGTYGRLVGKVTVIGGAGADSITAGSGIMIGGKISFTGAAGSDTLQADAAHLQNKVSLDNVETITLGQVAPVTVGSLKVENDEAASLVTFVLNDIVNIKGGVTYCGGENDDDVTIHSPIGGPVKIMLEGGTNSVELAGALGNKLTITGTTGTDTVDFTEFSTGIVPLPGDIHSVASVAKNVKLALGDGAKTINLADGSRFFGSVSVKTGSGNDTVNLGDAFILKNLALNLGGGTNAMQLDADNNTNGHPNHVVHGTLSYLGGSDGDTVVLDDLIAGGLKISVGDGANGISGIAEITGKKISIKGGAGVDTLNVGFDSTSAAFTAKLGAGDDMFTLSGSALKKASFDGGDGTDTFTGKAFLPVSNKLKNFETTS